MKVGLGFFVTGYTVDAITLAKAAESAGYSSFWVPDHTVLPVHPVTPYPGSSDGAIPRLYGEMADPFVLLSYIGAVTTKIRLATGICLIPERHPLTLAKTVSTLDNFSNGRVILGVGAGWLPEETELYGVPFGKRWTYMRESVQAMKALWANGSAAYNGAFVRFPEVRCDPLPAQRPHPPVIIGAPGTERTINRIVKWGDGWLPVMPKPEEVRRVRQSLTDRCEAAGRDPKELAIHVFVMDVTPETQERYEEAGADEIVIGLYNHPGTPLPYEEWASNRRAALSGPRPSAESTMAVLEKLTAQARL